MRELRQILETVAALRREGAAERAVVATVVSVAGSTYRRPGARMLALADGSSLGLVSGGCLEGDLLDRARSVRDAGRPCLVRYDSRSDDDIVWGLGLGCAGEVEVMLEPLGPSHVEGLDFLARCLATRTRGVLAVALPASGPATEAGPTTGPATGSGAARVGPRWSLEQGGSLTRHGPPSDLDAAVEQEARRRLQLGAAGSMRHRGRGGAARVFYEVVEPPVQLVVLGAGPDALPLCEAAAGLGWDLCVADWRSAAARAERFPSGARVVECRPEDVARHIEIDDRTAAITMTHHYLHDRELLRWLLPSRAFYVGALGPRQRTDDMLGDLRAEGVDPTDAQLERLFAPAGLDIGADAPEQIALAVVAEVQARLARRPGSWLRDRKGPIHDVPAD